jgi:hypothetical protein
MTQIDYFETSDLAVYLENMKQEILEEVCWDQKTYSSNSFIVRLKDLRSYEIYYLYQNKQLLYTIKELNNEI